MNDFAGEITQYPWSVLPLAVCFFFSRLPHDPLPLPTLEQWRMAEMARKVKVSKWENNNFMIFGFCIFLFYLHLYFRPRLRRDQFGNASSNAGNLPVCLHRNVSLPTNFFSDVWLRSCRFRDVHSAHFVENTLPDMRLGSLAFILSAWLSNF